jgi:hypothetical protein
MRKQRLEGEGEKGWDLACTAALSFICMVNDNVMIRFPRKRCLSISTTHAIRPPDREDKKIKNLKYFEVHDFQEKEPWING